jgi:membrane protease YdiL (CAAX protease family)
MKEAQLGFVLAGFRDQPPAPLASARHLRRFLYITVGIAAVMFLQAHRSPVQPGGARVLLYLSLIAVELILVWFVTIGIRARGSRLTDLVGPRWRSFAHGLLDLILAAGVALFLRNLNVFLYQFLGRSASNAAFLLPATLPEKTVWIAVSLAAGFCEEIVFRGYLQRQLWSLTRSLSFSLLLQAAVFGLGHIYQGWRPALVTAIYGLILGITAAWRRSIIPSAIAHSFVDILSGLRL